MLAWLLCVIFVALTNARISDLVTARLLSLEYFSIFIRLRSERRVFAEGKSGITGREGDQMGRRTAREGGRSCGRQMLVLCWLVDNRFLHFCFSSLFEIPGIESGRSLGILDTLVRYLPCLAIPPDSSWIVHSSTLPNPSGVRLNQRFAIREESQRR